MRTEVSSMTSNGAGLPERMYSKDTTEGAPGGGRFALQVAAAGRGPQTADGRRRTGCPFGDRPPPFQSEMLDASTTFGPAAAQVAWRLTISTSSASRSRNVSTTVAPSLARQVNDTRPLR